MTVWGYARVSTIAQDVQVQTDALLGAGVDEANVVVDHVSGTKASRPGLDRLLSQVEEGDVLTVWKLDRLGRSVSHLVALVDDLGRRGVQLRSLTEGLDTTTSGGRLMFHVMAAMAQFERDLIHERTAAGLEAARAKGATLGRPSKVTREQYQLIIRMAGEGASQRTIAATCGVPRATVGRIIRGEVPSLLRFRDEPRPDGQLPVASDVD
ncbi:recombinase family protein [Janibacter corallicola]|uniref:recombinase family protein n=1 Tax=Janibacter corallicola TaxID=415212 RepID=UPI000A01FD17|nr:recombinase family protein [Janibacter corallicola]